MNQGKYVFSQLLFFASHNDFKSCVSRYNGDYKVKDFSCWKQFLCMAFGQLTHRESLSDTILCLAANKEKLYHLGIGRSISKSTLSKANENRDWRIFADFAGLLIEQAKQLYSNESLLEIPLKQNAFAVDATVVDLCLSIFPWATFRRTKAAVKIHAQLNLKNNIPELVLITPASVHEVKFLDVMRFESGSFYVFDRGYIDYPRLFRIHKSDAYFVLRGRGRLRFILDAELPSKKETGVLHDQVVSVKNSRPHRGYPEKLRRIIFIDSEQKTYEFLTNNFDLPAHHIAQLYKHRWMIELFFKWIKQHLKIKTYWGHSPNAVKCQVWIAISVYVLVAILKRQLKLTQSLYEILQVLSINIFDRSPLIELFNNQPYPNPAKENRNQLKIFN